MGRVETIYVIAAEIECGECKARFADKVGDPRGQKVECPECGQELSVDSEPEFEFELER